MLQKLKQGKKEEGFTIIEVLIVLAIAGLILLVVFLAVPALQRNSRNTQRKNDVNAIMGAVNEFLSNNAGKLPTGSTTTEINGGGTTTPAGFKMGYYTASPVVTASVPAAFTPATSDTVTVVIGAQCDDGETKSGSV